MPGVTSRKGAATAYGRGARFLGREGDKKATDLATEHLPIVTTMVRRYAARPFTYDLTSAKRETPETCHGVGRLVTSQVMPDLRAQRPPRR